MNWIDKYKEELEDEELMDIEDDVIEMSFDDFMDMTAPNIRFKIAKERVEMFVALDEELKKRGYEDKDERYRIIELIY